MSTTDKYLWRACSSRHDWRDLRLAERWLTFLSKHSLIGPIEWTDVNEAGRVANEKYGSDHLAFLRGQERIIRKTDFFTTIEFGGGAPQEWDCFMALFPFTAGDGVEGMNSMQFAISTDSLKNNPSALLWQGLQQVHDSDNTEYALIHPYVDYHRLKEYAYRNPITVSVLFDGVYWANFLDRAYLEEFQMDQLYEKLAVDFITHTEETGGLFFRLNSSISTVAEKEATERMKQMSLAFKKALSPSSKWYQSK